MAIVKNLSLLVAAIQSSVPRRSFRILSSSLMILTLGLLPLVNCGGGGGGPKPPDPAVAPTITTQPASVTVNPGQPVALTVVSTGTVPLSYQWKKDGVNFPGAFSATFTINSAQSTDSGSYTVVVSNSAGSVTSSAAVLTVNTPPTITTQPASQTVNQGQAASFSVVATGTAPFSYQWKLGGVAISGATAATYGIASVQPGNAGSYTVVVSNSVGPVTSSAAVLTVNTPPTITTQPSNQAVNQGQVASFSVAATGTAPLSYQWQKGGVAINGANAAAFAIASAQPGDAGTYTVVVSNSVGPVTSIAATLTVNPLPVIRTFTASQTIPIGGAGVLTWDVTGATSISVDNGVGVLGSASGTRNVSPSATTAYTLTATNAAGPVTATATATQVVDTTPFQINSFSAAPATVPFGGSATLTWSYAGLPLSLTLDGALVAGISAPVSPVRRQNFTLLGMNGAGSDNRSIKVAAKGLDLVAGNADGIGSIDGLATAARFYNPRGIAVDALGNTYVADTENMTIRKISSSGTVITLAGKAGLPGSYDGTGAAAQFDSAEGIAVDASGNVYVADTNNQIIRKITPGGTVSTLAGTPYVTGSTDGPGAAARFNYPCGIAVDAAGNVYVADTFNSTIRKITPMGVVSTLAGTAGVTGSADGNGAAAQFNHPPSVAADAAGNVYVADIYNNSIRKITSGGVVSTLAGGTWGSADGTGAAAQFGNPQGVTVDVAGNIYVAEISNLIRRITPVGVVTTIAGTAGGTGSTDGTGSAARFNYPRGVAVDISGNLYVADTFNNTIRKITPGTVVSTWAGTAGFDGSADGASFNARFLNPQGLAVDVTGNTYVADTSNQTIRKITPEGMVSTIAGAIRTSGSADGNGGAARFKTPRGVAVDTAGNVFVADTDNHTIRRITPVGVVSTFAGSAGVSGSADGLSGTAGFNGPRGVAVDAAGNVYVADTFNSTIRKITPGGLVTTLAGSAGSSGSADGTGASARFWQPHGVAVDATGNVYVADTVNHTIRKITPGGVVTTLAGRAAIPQSMDGTGSSAGFYSPRGLAVDLAGNVYVADMNNQAIRKVTPVGVVTTVAGQFLQSGFRPGLLPGYLVQPANIAMTPDGDLIVNCNNGIIQITAPN